MSQLEDSINSIPPIGKSVEPTMAQVKYVVNNHSAQLKSLIQTTSTLIDYLKSVSFVSEVVRPPWWKFWARSTALRQSVFIQANFDEHFKRLKKLADDASALELMKRQAAESERILNEIVFAGADSPVYNGEGACIESTSDGSMRLVKG